MSSNYKVVAYLPGYATNQNYKYIIEDTAGSQLTHLIYCFAGAVPGQLTQVDLPEPHDLTKNFVELMKLKGRFPALKIVISLGGSGKSFRPDMPEAQKPHAIHFREICADQNLRTQFISSCLDTFFRKDQIRGLFDGVDLDWEHPLDPDKANFTAFIKEFRTALDVEGGTTGRSYTLSIAVPSFGSAQGIDYASINAHLDWISDMSYHMNSPFEPFVTKTSYSAPLHAPPPLRDVPKSIDDLRSSGADPAKILMGLSTIGAGFADVPDVNDGINQSFSGPSPGTMPGTDRSHLGKIFQKDVIDHRHPPEYRLPVWDDTAKASSIYSPSEKIWISPQFAQDVNAKAEYVKANGLAGFMIWQLGADKQTDESVLHAAAVSLSAVV